MTHDRSIPWPIRRLRHTAQWSMEDSWKYTRSNTIKHIRYFDDFSGYNSIPHRIIRAIESGYGSISGKRHLYYHSGKANLKARLISAYFASKYSLATETHAPDGVVADGRIITFWEEDGEYLECVSPEVGLELADWLEEDPTNPHAVKIMQYITGTMYYNDLNN